MWHNRFRKTSSFGQLHGVDLRAVRDFHLKRVDCTLRKLDSGPEGSPNPVRLLLNDVTIAGLAIYSTFPLPLSALVVLEMDYPEPMRLQAKVGWCQQLISIGRIITKDPPSYRIGLVLAHETPEEEAKARAFCEKLAEVYPGIDLTRAPYAA